MSYRKLSLASSQRKAVLKNSVASLIEAEKITTTETRAKEIKKITDKMITLGKKGDLHSRRQALAFITSEAAVDKLFSDIAGRYTDRQGGYTRIIKTGNRKGDGAPMVILELVD
ncbi:MAG: 50S ribosomal protein L17 [Syntrophomonadaceae bacterium]|nr:50S ribosomal protein L17 [Syntrophomonadaceae bacterium]